MAGTEIDDIFRGKTPKVRNVQKGKEGEKESRAEKGKVGEGSATAQKGKEKRKKKASAHTNQEEPVQKKNANPESKKKAETIVDPSQSIGKKSEKPNKQAKKTKLSEEDEQFRDSRGSKREYTLRCTSLLTSFRHAHRRGLLSVLGSRAWTEQRGRR